jgi:hypothetical protein
MQSQATLKRHAALIDNMAQALDIDLEEHMLRGNLTISELEDAVLRCTVCSKPDACDHWVAERAGQTASAAPGYCRNADVFQRLKEG